MKDEYIRQGETFEVTLTDEDLTAQDVILTVSEEQGAIRLQAAALYETVDGKRIATVSFTDPSLEVGEYRYMYTINYSDDHVEKFPDISKCEDDNCELPKLIVCEANDVSGS